MKTLSVFTLLYAIAYSLAWIYGTSIPGGGPLVLSFAVIVLFFPLVALWGWVCVSSLMLRKLQRAVWTVPLTAAVTGAIIFSGVVERGHWEFIEDDLTAAKEANICPHHAGLMAVSDCTDFFGAPAYGLGSGPLDQVYITQATEFPAGYELQRELGDGWRVALHRF